VTAGATPDPTETPREPLYARLRRVMGPQLILVFVLIALALFRFGTRQTTSATLEGVVPQNGRLVTQQPLGEVHALLVERGDAFQLLMAYEVQDGWVALHLRQPPSNSEYAIEQSMGHAPVPAFTAAYGRLHGTLAGAIAKVRIAWSDGPQDVPIVDDGFLAVREGRFTVERVSLLGSGGDPVRDLDR
jgi:hypothetical protein